MHPRRRTITWIAFPIVLLLAHLGVGSAVVAADPVNLRTGNLTLPGIDISLPSLGPPLELSRTYNSRSTAAGLFGEKWQSNLEVQARRLPGSIAIVEADGALIEFKPEEATARPPSPGSRYRATTRGREELEERPDGSLLRRTVTGQRELFDREGRLARIEDRNGNALRLEYQGDKVAKLEDASGRTLTLTYGGPGGRFVTAVTDPAGGVIRYQYDQPGRLISVTDQVGRQGRYEYDSGDRLVRLVYADGAATHMTYEGDSGAVLTQQGPGLGQTTYRYEWEPGGLLSRRTTVTDVAGRKTTYEYAQGGRESVIIDPSGRRTAILYDPDLNRALSLIGPQGIRHSYQYDRSGQLLSETDALRQTTRYRYDPAGLLREVTDGAGRRMRFDYDARGNGVAVTDADGTATRDVYDVRGQIIERIDPTGARTRFRYDQAGNLVEQIDALGQKSRYEYDLLGRLVRRVEPNEAETRWTYNGVGDLLKKVDAEGRVTEYRYDSMRRLTAEIDPAGRITRYEYDRIGQLVAVVNPAGGRTIRSYTADGRLQEIKDPSGVLLRNQYDPVGRRVASVDGLGHRTQYEYDGEGRLVAMRDPTGAELRVAYDAGGRPTALSNQSARARLSFDRAGRIEAFTGADGKTWRYRFDALGNVMEVRDPGGGKAGYRYDPAGRLLQQVDPAGRAVRYRRDPLGRVIEVEDPSGGALRLAYDAIGNVVAVHAPSGKAVRYESDRLGRLVGTGSPDGSERRFEYDRAGNVVAAKQGNDAIRYGYDGLNRLVSVEHVRLKKTIRYEYDGAGRRTAMFDPAGGVTRYRYDAAGRLVELTPPDRASLRFTHDAAGRTTEIQYPNGVRAKIAYDASGKVASMRHEREGRPFAGVAYQYDADGRVTVAAPVGGAGEHYRYDLLSRLGQITRGEASGVEYQYLPDGSRAQVVSGSSAVTYRYDEAGRLLAAGDATFRHDPDGNLTERGGPGGVTKYQYDADRRLAKVTRPDDKVVAYGYDPDGQRLWRRDEAGMTYYLHDGFNLLAELDDRFSVNAVYVHGEGLDAPLVMIRGGKSYYYHPDRLGSILALTDARGEVVASYRYDPFGVPTSLQAGVANPFLFTAREYDSATGLYHYRAREYDPALGRFLTKDPLPGTLLDPRTLHSYVYVYNNPLSFTDPLGLAGWSDPAMIPGLPSSGPIKPSDIANIKNPFTRAHILQEINSVATRHPGPFGVSITPRIDPKSPLTLTVWPNNAPPVTIYPKPLGVAEGMANIPIPKGPVEVVPAPKPPGPATPVVTPEPSAPIRPTGPTVVEPAPSGGAGVAPKPGGITVGGVLTGIAVVAGVVHIATAEDKPRATVEVAGGWVGATYGAGVGAWLGPPGAIIGGLIGGIVGSVVGGCLVGPCPESGPPQYLPPEHVTDPTKSQPATGTSAGTPVIVPIPDRLPISPTTVTPVVPVGPAPTEPPPFVPPKPLDIFPLLPPPMISVPPMAGEGLPPEPPIGGEWPRCHPYSPNNPDCEPKGGKEPLPGDVSGAGQQPFGGAIPTQGPTSGGTGGIVIKQPDLNAPLAGPTESGTIPGQPPPGQGPGTPGPGYWCYSEKTKEKYWTPMGPCPPPSWEPPVRWQGLVPPEGTPPMGGTGGACKPPCHVKPETKMCHCPGDP
jgi:RHS repeat-associated protein